MKVFYSRVFTTDKNIPLQMDNLNGFDYVITDYCTGLINIWE